MERMVQGRKRKSSNTDGGFSTKRRNERTSPPPNTRRDSIPSAVNMSARPNTRQQRRATLRTPSTPPSFGDLVPELDALRGGKNFFVYRFLNTLHSSYAAPEDGTAGPVEQFTSVSYPGEDDRFWDLDEGCVVPREVVEDNGLQDAALQILEGTKYDERGRFSSHAHGEPALPPSPSLETSKAESFKRKLWPPRRQGVPYVLVPANPYLAKHGDSKGGDAGGGGGHVQKQKARSLVQPPSQEHSSRDKGKARYISSESEDNYRGNGEGEDEERSSPGIARYQVSPSQGDRRSSDNGDNDQEAQAFAHTIDDASQTSRRDPHLHEPVVDNNFDQAPDHVENEGPEAEDSEADDLGGLPESWKSKGGRPPKAFFKDAAAIEEAYYHAISSLMTSYSVSQKVAYIATGLQPRKIETRETSSWNAHQRVYKIQHPKAEGESVPEYKARCRFQYLLDVKPLTKEERVKFNADCDETVMDYFFNNLAKELKAVSPAKRVEAACKMLQKTAQMISRADREIQSYGGVNYIGSDRAGRAAGGGIFVSSDLVLRTIKVFNLGTSSMVLKAGDFLQAAVAQSEMQEASRSVESVSQSAEKTTKDNGKAGQLVPKEARVPTVVPGDECSYVEAFNRMDFRKRGRNYLGFTYNKVGGRQNRTNVDWANLLTNFVNSEFRLENCSFSPHPGQPTFSVGGVLPKQWQEIGRMLSAEDFHPVTGGCNKTAPRFVPWTQREKELEKGSENYYDIPVVVGPKGDPLLTVRQVGKCSFGSEGNPASADSGEEEENDLPILEGSRPSDHEAADRQQSRREGSHSARATRLGSHPAPSPTGQPHSARPFNRRKHAAHGPTLIPEATSAPGLAALATSSRNSPPNRDLNLNTSSSVAHTNPVAPAPSVTSAVRAFYAKSTYVPPSNRGLVFPASGPSAQQGGSSHPISGAVHGPSQSYSDASRAGPSRASSNRRR